MLRVVFKQSFLHKEILNLTIIKFINFIESLLYFYCVFLNNLKRC